MCIGDADHRHDLHDSEVHPEHIGIRVRETHDEASGHRADIELLPHDVAVERLPRCLLVAHAGSQLSTRHSGTYFTFGALPRAVHVIRTSRTAASHSTTVVPCASLCVRAAAFCVTPDIEPGSFIDRSNSIVATVIGFDQSS